MDDISQFRGFAGEVCRQFVKFNTFLTIIPLLLFWAAIYFVMYMLGNSLPNILFFLINLIATSFLLARFTIPACEGEFNTGFFSRHFANGSIGSFMLRYNLYMFAWMIPVFLLAKYVLNTHSLLSMFMFSPNSLGASSSFHGLVVLIIVIAILLGPTISCLLAAVTSSLEEVFSLGPIMWLWQDRRQDLGSYYAMTFGSLFVFYVKYIIPLSLINMLIYKSSFQAGMAFSYFITLLPLLVSPIIIGRLSGAFVAGEPLISDPTLDDLASPASPAPGNASGPQTSGAYTNNQAQPEAESWADMKNQFHEVTTQLDNMSPEAIDERIQHFKSLDKSNVFVQLALTHLTLKRNMYHPALEQGKVAIKSCLKNGMGFEAVQLFQLFKQDKTKLNLDNNAKISLGAYLTSQSYYMDAAWCYMTVIASAKTEDEALESQKKFIDMVDKAQRANEHTLAYQLYQLFLKQCPNSTLADFVAEQLNTLQVRLGES